MAQLVNVVQVVACPTLVLELEFSDGFAASVDLGPRLAWLGVFAELRENARLFMLAAVDPERQVVCWPNGADLDSDQLRAWADGREAPVWAEEFATAGGVGVG